MQRQDSSHPTGVAQVEGTPENHSQLSVSRRRKAEAAVELRVSGADWATVAETLGYPTPRSALVAAEKALAGRLETEDRDSLRKLVGLRLDTLLRGIWPKASDPSDPEHLAAVPRAREVIADYRRLFGLDMPTEVIIHSPTAAELESWVAMVMGDTGVKVDEYDIITGEVVEDFFEGAS